jgi:hypothetical protein
MPNVYSISVTDEAARTLDYLKEATNFKVSHVLSSILETLDIKMILRIHKMKVIEDDYVVYDQDDMLLHRLSKLHDQFDKYIEDIKICYPDAFDLKELQKARSKINGMIK